MGRNRTFAASLLLVAVLIGGVAIGMVLQSSLLTTASQTGTAEVRIAATPRSDGSVAVGLQQQGDDGTWGAVQHPRLNVLRADAEPDRTRFSSTLTVTTQADASTLADQFYEWGFGAGTTFTQVLPDQAGTTTALCFVNPASGGADAAVCEGWNAVEPLNDAEIVSVASPLEGITILSASIARGETPDVVLTAEVSMLLGLLQVQSRLRAGDEVFRIAFPLDATSIEPPAGSEYCVIGHGEDVPARQGEPVDTFWAMTKQAAEASARHLGVDLRFYRLPDAAERAKMIRECVSDGAAAIAVTLAETEHVVDAIREARAAGVPVVTYNSGGSHAQAAGSLLHLGLNDREAGEVAGQRLTDDGVTGPALCLLHEEQNVGLRERCEGLASAYAEVERVLVIDDFSALSERLTAGDVGAVVTLNASSVIAALGAIQAAGVSPTLASIGMDTTLPALLLSGQLSFAVQDKPIEQGYLIVAMAALAQRTFLVPDLLLGGSELLIQPTILDPQALARIMASLQGQ